MKKKLSLLMAIVMIVTTVMTALPVITIPAVAAGDTFSVAADQAADGVGGTYATLVDAVKAVKDGGTIKMTANYAVSERTDQDSVTKTKGWTLDGNGNTWSIASNTWALRVGAANKTITFKNITFDYSGTVAADRILQTSNVGTSCTLVLGEGTRFTKTGSGKLARAIMNQPCAINVDGAVFELDCPAIGTWGDGVYNVILTSGTLSADANGAIYNGYETDSSGSTVTATGNMKVYTGATSTRDISINDINLKNAQVSLPGKGVTVYETTETVVNGETVYGIGNIYVAPDGSKVENGDISAAYALVAKATKDITIKLNEDITKNVQWTQPTHTVNVVIDGSDGNGGRYTFTNNQSNAFRMDSIGDLVFKDIILINLSGSGVFVQLRTQFMTLKFINCDVYSKPQHNAVNAMGRDMTTLPQAMQDAIQAYNTENGTSYTSILNIVVENSNIYAYSKPAISLNTGNANHYYSVTVDNSIIASSTQAIEVANNAVADITVNNSTLLSSSGAAINASGTGVAGTITLTGTSRLLGSSGAANNLDADYTLTGTNTATAPLSMNVGGELAFVVATWMTPFVSADAATGDNADFTINLTSDITLNLTYGASTFASPANAKVVVNGLKGTDGKYKIASTGYNVILTKDDTVSRNITFQNIQFDYGTASNADAGNFMQPYCSGTLALKNCIVTVLGEIRWSWIALNTNNGSNLTFILENTTITGNGTDKNSTGLLRADKNAGSVTIKMINSTIDASAHESLAIYAVARHTLYMKNSAVKSNQNLPISGAMTVVHNEGEWTNNTFRTTRTNNLKAGIASTQVLPFGTAKFTEDVCPAEIWVNGAKVNTVATWNALQTDVQSRLTSNDVTVKLTGDAKLACGYDSWKTIGVAGHTLTIESANANDRATVYVYATHHAFHPAGNVVFKNVNLYQNTSNSLFNLSANTKLVTLENVDLTVGNIVQYGTFVGAGINMGSATEQAKLNFINVNYSKVNGATYHETYMLRIANPGDDTKYYLDITLDGCNVDYTGAKGGLITAGTYDKASVARNLNLIVKNSKIKSVGADAIDNADYITAIKLDAKSTFTYTNNLAKPIDNDGSNFGVIQTGGQKISVVVGDTKTTYTNWNAAVTAANAATEDATILLESDVIIEYNGGSWNTSGAGGVELKNANGKKITVDGQNKYGINALNSGNTIYMGGDIEFKNMTIADSVVGSLFDMRQQANLTLTNVDFYGAGTHEYTVICTLYASNVPFNVTLNNVTAQGYSGSKNNNQISFIRTGNPGMANFVNITMFNCDIDMSACPNADVIAVTNATTANITVVNTELKNPEGAGKAINVGTANTNAAPEGFGTATKITNVGSTFSSVTSGVVTDVVNKEDVTPEMKDGASVRINTEELTQNGIRFTSVFTSDVLATIETIADDANFKFGTLITITDAVKANGGKFDASAIRKLGYTVADVAATEGVTVDKDTADVIVRAALINLKDNTRKYSAIAYVEFTVNGNVCRIYSDYNEADNSRSMAQIAQAALDDVKRPGDAGYDSKVYIYSCGAGFSPYTAAQRAVLESYLD